MTFDNSNVDLESGSTDVYEIQASEKGWVPQDQWDGDPNQWRPAKEFVERGELMDRISNQSRQLNKYNSEIEELRNSMKELAEHNKKVAELEYAKALDTLKRQKAEALDMGDHSTVVEIDEQMSELKETKKASEKTVSQQGTENSQSAMPPEVTQWMAENTWYNENILLQGAADAIAKRFVMENPGVQSSPKIVLEHVTQEIKREFADKFEGPKRRPSATNDTSSNGNTQPKGKGKKYSVNHLSPEQRTIAKRFAATGVMTEQDYVDQLAELGEID